MFEKDSFLGSMFTTLSALLLCSAALSGCTALTSNALQDPGGSDGSVDAGVDGAVDLCDGIAEGLACGEADAGTVCHDGDCVEPCSGSCIEGLICNVATWACEPACVRACELPEVCNEEKRQCEDPCAPDGEAIPCAGGETCIEGNCVFDCGAQGNGTWCNEEETELCMDGACVLDTCGNAFRGAAESCDDGNDIDFDGCTGCRPDCSSNEQCGDGESCNGEEMCAESPGSGAFCEAGEPLGENDGCEHSDPDVDGAVCREGECTPPGCGNNTLDDGEECDPSAGEGNDANCVGCRWMCLPDVSGRGCPQGPDLCSPSVCVDNACQDTPIDCTGISVTDGSCQEAVCDGGECVVQFKSGIVDGDKDLHAEGCEKLCDCNDGDGSTHCSAEEFCDGKNVDNDCDPNTTEPGAWNYYADADKDAFGGAFVANTCEAPPGTTTVTGDCWDSAAFAEAEIVNPRYLACQSATEHLPTLKRGKCDDVIDDWASCVGRYGPDWSTKCTSDEFLQCWDRDCDRKITPTYPSRCSEHSKETCGFGILAGGEGTLPCGAEGDWEPCRWTGFACEKPLIPLKPFGCAAKGNLHNKQGCY